VPLSSSLIRQPIDVVGLLGNEIVALGCILCRSSSVVPKPESLSDIHSLWAPRDTSDTVHCCSVSARVYRARSLLRIRMSNNKVAIILFTPGSSSPLCRRAAHRLRDKTKQKTRRQETWRHTPSEKPRRVQPEQ